MLLLQARIFMGLDPLLRRIRAPLQQSSVRGHSGFGCIGVRFGTSSAGTTGLVSGFNRVHADLRQQRGSFVVRQYQIFSSGNWLVS